MDTNIARTFIIDNLKVVIASDRKKVGELSAERVAKLIKELLKHQEEVRIVFAAAPSQNEFLYELSIDKSIDWSRVIAFHMDEYIGLPADSDKLFAKYLTDRIFSKVQFKKVYLINSQETDVQKECGRYESLLKEKIIDIVCMGIGENGHIAFNDPPVADFNDPEFIKIVVLDERCKIQQVNDAGFGSVDEVPKTAYTLTVPALLSAHYLSIAVPGKRKAEAVRNTLLSEISAECPSTVLRHHPEAILYLDIESASLLE